MPEREQMRKTSERRQDEATTEVEPASGAAAERADKLKADLDDLLDEIDEVLEDNAEEFVRNYVQKGGQ
jgi:ubiquitin-like protein Pup